MSAEMGRIIATKYTHNTLPTSTLIGPQKITNAPKKIRKKDYGMEDDDPYWKRALLLMRRM